MPSNNEPPRPPPPYTPHKCGTHPIRPRHWYQNNGGSEGGGGDEGRGTIFYTLFSLLTVYIHKYTSTKQKATTTDLTFEMTEIPFYVQNHLRSTR